MCDDRLYSHKIGNKKTKPSAEVTGDKDVTIINNQKIHSEYPDEHAMKLSIILVIVCIQLLIVTYEIWHKRVQKKTLNKVKSIADVNMIYMCPKVTI